MRSTELPDAVTMAAARAGDQRALDALVEGWLPLVYNIVGRALDGHADVDDVVQETMLRVVRGLPDLQDPDRFRSWLVAIAMSQVRDRWRARRKRPAAELPEEAADPGADFVDLSVLRLGLTGQRREVAEATRWLEPDERQLLSLWWLEAAGELTRDELAAACEITPRHAAVRVQRMKARLDAARAVVRALRTTPSCLDLQAAASEWNGKPSALWRKRLARHTRECPECARHWADLLPAEGLLAGLALTPLPVGLTAGALLGGGGGGAIGGAHAAGVAERLVHAVQALWAKPVAVATAGAVTVAGGAAVVYGTIPRDVDRGDAAAPRTSASVTARAVPPSPAPSRPKARPEKRSAYGETVDGAEATPPPNRRPRALPRRPTGRALTITGRYNSLTPGRAYGMVHRGEQLTVAGKGYFQVRWQVAFAQRAGHMQMPTWTGLKGRLFHVASGGGHRMDDAKPGQSSAHTWMGQPDAGYAVLPGGAQQMWQNEFYYVDGSVTLHQNEKGADYNIYLMPVTWTEIADDVNEPPSAPGHPVRYGLVRDTGGDDGPVPQYLTRAAPEDPMTVRQRTKIGPL
ncbi:RNA polymerase sigma factor [Spirillospora sp. CA-142024]|uniref:RNA polymerase sigma factor n=1 Tax=Spirillospora sp. CA-142024 TaxID=3240036 RepID=UPI003D8B3761